MTEQVTTIMYDCKIKHAYRVAPMEPTYATVNGSRSRASIDFRWATGPWGFRGGAGSGRGRGRERGWGGGGGRTIEGADFVFSSLSISAHSTCAGLLQPVVGG